MHSDRAVELDSTAVRVALWRAMHVQIDPPPHVFEDEVVPKAGSSKRSMAQPSGHEPVHAALPRLLDLNFSIPSFLKLVPVDLEAGDM